MKIKACGSYHAVIENCELLTMADGKSVFKVYFVSIVERDTPERFEWSANPISKSAYLDYLKTTDLEGVGFVTAFPHITKVFRYAPQSEILMHVKAFNTQTKEIVNLDREDGYTEFACLAEAMLANDEYLAWAKATSVREYLDYRSPSLDAPVVSNSKMAEYFAP